MRYQATVKVHSPEIYSDFNSVINTLLPTELYEFILIQSIVQGQTRPGVSQIEVPWKNRDWVKKKTEEDKRHFQVYHGTSIELDPQPQQEKEKKQEIEFHPDFDVFHYFCQSADTQTDKPKPRAAVIIDKTGSKMTARIYSPHFESYTSTRALKYTENPTLEDTLVFGGSVTTEKRDKVIVDCVKKHYKVIDSLGPYYSIHAERMRYMQLPETITAYADKEFNEMKERYPDFFK